MRLWTWLAGMVAMLLAAPVSAREVALVIANSNYQATTRLTNPAHDADIVAKSLEEAGFDQILRADDLDFDHFREKLREFQNLARGADTALVYYAGHGIEGRNENWLVPVDAKLASASDLPFEAIELQLVLDSLQGAQLRVAFLDACRDNPFARNWDAKTRAVQTGLAPVEADDVLVIFAAAPGQQAFDGGDGNSPFAAALAKRIVEPDLPVQMLGGMVRDDVLAATGEEQRPFVSASITGKKTYLTTEQRARAPTENAKLGNAEMSSALVDNMMDSKAWDAAASMELVEGYEAYLETFPDGKFRKFAQLKIAKLKNSAPKN